MPSGSRGLLERRRSGSARIEISRKFDDKPRTTAGRVLDPRASPVHQHELTHNRQTNSTSADRSIGFRPAREAVSRIAKEGRKYGVFLGLVTQRPAQLDRTLISQCSTVFAMRMANEDDQRIVHAAVSDPVVETYQEAADAEADVAPATAPDNTNTDTISFKRTTT